LLQKRVKFQILKEQIVMPRIIPETQINAPSERCFNLSKRIDLHKISTGHTDEEAIDGVARSASRDHQENSFLTF
tara:strand:- start:89336 stop:89560 length:225 start_codon:yes stop_codon:yes gene_type:complete